MAIFRSIENKADKDIFKPAKYIIGGQWCALYIMNGALYDYFYDDDEGTCYQDFPQWDIV